MVKSHKTEEEKEQRVREYHMLKNAGFNSAEAYILRDWSSRKVERCCQDLKERGVKPILKYSE